jgi:hypothetical protein
MCYTGKEPWKDPLEAMKRQGFEQEYYLKGFSVMIQQSSQMMRFRHKGVDNTHLEVEKKEIRKDATWFKILLGSIIPLRNHHVEDSRVVTRL